MSSDAAGQVVPVARKPDRSSERRPPKESRKLAQIARRSEQPVRVRRAVVVVMAPARHQPVGLIAKRMRCRESYVRQVIHDFNKKFRRTGPKMERGPISEDRSSDTRSDLSDRSVLPRNLEWLCTTWSLSRPVEAEDNAIADVNRETVRKP
ncbi:helix-turn-helix domain-containing protein [Nocardia sp. NPDC004168]|uniref:helix-turn-helix domain-containing protein n=1 Tax=Nocardia sp. NPDC004168 TaxID=3154452 RepID=UPI0033A5C7AF